jgi:serine/threonine protein kinase
VQQRGVRHEQRAAGVVSDHIGQLLDYGDDRGFSYLVYPLYRPGSLSVYCRWLGNQRTLRWCAQVIDGVLAGLMAASVAGLVHLDIKPGNIVLDGDRVRVIDWGLSRVWNASQPSTWIVRGTPFFACPEQLLRPKAKWDTPRADLYGVGATFYWLLTGEAPLQHEATEESDFVGYRNLLLKGVRAQPVHKLVPGIPRPLGMLIDRWLSFEPGKRVPTGTPMVDSLRVAREQLNALRPALPDMTVGRVTSRRHRRPR